MKTSLLAESSFAIMFPKTLKQQISDMWPQVVARLEPLGINATLDANSFRMEVTTTARTWDPYAILKARELVRLVARGMGVASAAKVLEDGFDCDIINIGDFTKKVSSFNKRRQRLMGPNGATQKAIELLTGCDIFMLGNTVSVVGPYRGLGKVRKIVEETMGNKMHPVYNIKELMAKRELAKDPSMEHENWARHVPTYAKVKRPKLEKREGEEPQEQQRKKNPKKKKGPYNPFPNPPTPRKIDLEMESGAYLLSQEQKEAKEKQEKIQASNEKSKQKQKKRADSFIAPKEKKNKKKNKTGNPSTQTTIDNIKQNLGVKKTKQSSKTDDFILKKKQKT
eukprot:Phypoly_transcript_12250.p1 GENE.Phypoly_transcript_12250~~Phypoly_transcript_12250.p1  ORF type:complete len:381 (-),score=95.24 Phypoly_transcript_12250:11-1024(-)